MAKLSRVSTFFANLTLAKLPSPSVLPSSYFPTRVLVTGLFFKLIFSPDFLSDIRKTRNARGLPNAKRDTTACVNRNAHREDVVYDLVCRGKGRKRAFRRICSMVDAFLDMRDDEELGSPDNMWVRVLSLCLLSGSVAADLSQ